MGKLLFVVAIASGIGLASWKAQAAPFDGRAEINFEHELDESNEAACSATGDAELSEAIDGFDSLVRRRDAYFATRGFIGYVPYFLECVDSEGLGLR